MAIEVTDVRITSIPPAGGSVLAYADIVIGDALIIRGARLVRTQAGHCVAMPSRMAMARCPGCSKRVSIADCYCRNCGGPLPRVDAPTNSEGREVLYFDHVHPVTTEARLTIERAVFDAYQAALDEAKADSPTPLAAYPA